MKHRGAKAGRARLTLTLAAALVLLLQASCSAMSRPQVTKTVTDKDAGSQVVLASGDVLIVKLEAVPGTGYGWEIADLDTTILSPLGEPTIESTGKGGPGAQELQVFRLQAAKAGSSLLKLDYVRPWEKDTPPIKTYSINVEVR